MEACRRSAASSRVVVGLAAAVLLPFFLLAPLARPEADDFVFAGIVAEHGFLGAQAWWYTHWCGRFVSTAVLSALPAGCDLIAAYPWACLGLLVAQVAATWWFLAALGRSIPGRLSIRQSGAAAVVLSALYVTQMPNPREGFFWLSGAITYQLPTILALGLGALGLSIRRDASRLGVAWRAGSATGLAFAIGGCNETVWLPGALVLAAAVVWTLRGRHPSGPLWIAALVGLAAAAIVVYVAPGNAARLAYHADRPPAIANLGMALWTSLRYTAKWIARPAPWAVVLLLVAAPDDSAATHPAPAAKRARWLPWAWLAAAAYGIVLSGFLATFLATGHKPPARAQNPVFFLFLMVWLAGSAMAWRAGRGGPGVVPRRARTVARLAIGLLVVGMLAVGNLPAAVYDLVVRAPAYHRATAARYAAMSEAARAGRRCGWVAPLGASGPMPRTLGGWEIGEDAYIDRYFARYFGLESVALAEDAAGRCPMFPTPQQSPSRNNRTGPAGPARQRHRAPRKCQRSSGSIPSGSAAPPRAEGISAARPTARTRPAAPPRAEGISSG